MATIIYDDFESFDQGTFVNTTFDPIENGIKIFKEGDISEYQYFKEATVTNTADVNTLFEIRIGSGTDSNTLVFIPIGHINDDFSDLKVTDEFNIDLNFYIDSKIEGDKAFVYIAINNKTKIRFHYGKEGAVSLSNFDTTFPLKESCEIGLDPLSRWGEKNPGDFNLAYVTSQKAFGNKGLECDVVEITGTRWIRLAEDTGSKYGYFEFWIKHYTTSISDEQRCSLYDANDTVIFTIRFHLGSIYYFDGTIFQDTGETYNLDTWDGFRIFFDESSDIAKIYRWSGSAWVLIQDNAQRNTWTGNIKYYYIIWVDGKVQTMYHDHMRCIKEAVTMPTYTWGSEQPGSISETDNWWNEDYLYRYEIYFNTLHDEIETNITLIKNFDHETLVTDLKSLANGDDLRIVFQNESDRDTIVYTDLDRDIINPNSENTEIAFRLPEILEENAERIAARKKIYLYYGNLSAVNPPTNLDNVYAQFDHFNTDTSSEYETEPNRGSWVYNTTESRIEASYSSGVQDGLYLHKRIDFLEPTFPLDIEFRFYPHWFVDVSNITSDIFILLNAENSTISDTENFLQFGSQKRYVGFPTLIRLRTLILNSIYDNGTLAEVADDTWHILKLKLRKNKIIIELNGVENFFITWQNFTEIYSQIPDWESFYLYLASQFTEINTYFYIDYYKVIHTVNNPPTVLFSPEETINREVTGGFWKSNLIDIVNLETYLNMTIKTNMTLNSQSVDVLILDESQIPITNYQYHIRNALNQSEEITVFLENLPSDPIFIIVYLAKLSPGPILQSIELLYDEDIQEDGKIIIGTQGINAIFLEVDRYSGIINYKGNFVPQHRIPERDGNIIQFMGSQIETYTFKADIKIEDELRLRQMLATEQPLFHNFLRKQFITQNVHIKTYNEIQNIGVEGYITITMTTEVIQ